MPWTHGGATSYVIGLVTKERPADYKLLQTAVVAPSCRLVTAAQVQQPTPARKVCAQPTAAQQVLKQIAPSRITPQLPATTRNRQRESQRIALFEAHDPRSVTSRSLLDPAPRLRAAPSRPLLCPAFCLSVRPSGCLSAALAPQTGVAQRAQTPCNWASSWLRTTEHCVKSLGRCNTLVPFTPPRQPGTASFFIPYVSITHHPRPLPNSSSPPLDERQPLSAATNFSVSLLIRAPSSSSTAHTTLATQSNTTTAPPGTSRPNQNHCPTHTSLNWVIRHLKSDYPFPDNGLNALSASPVAALVFAAFPIVRNGWRS